ncbi:MAG: response regulator transcription factor [Bacteroidota bacterium]
MNKPRILYVEDEVFLAKIVKEGLEGRGYDVHLVTEGDAVLDAFHEYLPDICVFDVMLPQKDGFEIAELIRQADRQTPILFVTAKTETEDVVKGFKAGGNDYIRKPFSMEELVVRLENLLQLVQQNPAKPSPNAQITLGQFTFSPTKLELAHPTKKTIQLSYREVQILNLLCEHINQVLERKKLLLEVWGDDSFFNSRNLDVYIRKLRSYLAADEQVSILTLKGVGYRFCVED